LRDVIERAKKLQVKLPNIYLLATKLKKPYSKEGFNSTWDWLMERALKENVIKEKFRFHDIRRKAATDAQREYGLEFARQGLVHATQAMTDHYISGEIRVTPFK